MRIVFAIIGSLLILYVFLRYEGEHKYISNFFDELWIKINDGVSQSQHACLSWIDKTKLISLHIIDIFFERAFFSCKGLLSSFVFIKMIMFFHFSLLCMSFVIKYGTSIKMRNIPYGITFFVPFFDEVAIVPLALSFEGFSTWHMWVISLVFLLLALLFLVIRFLIHNYSLWIGAIIVTALTVLNVCLRWNNLGSSIRYLDRSGNILEDEFISYSIGSKLEVISIDTIVLPFLLLIIVYVLRRIFLSKNTRGYIVQLFIAIVLGGLFFCYFVLFVFLANNQGCIWTVGLADFLPDIFAPVATLAIIIFIANVIIVLLISLLFLADRIVYIVPKYRIIEKDKILLCIGVILLLISLSGKTSIKEIIKVIVDRII